MSVPEESTDFQLVTLLNQGNEYAFSLIYQRYAERLTNFAASKLYSLDDARDVLHDLFVKLWADRQALQLTGSLESYLFSAIRYRIVDKIRRNITREEYAALVQTLERSYPTSTDQLLQVRELETSISNALLKLPAKTQQIYHLSRQEHHTVAEIAQLLGLSEQTIKNQLTLALKHLRQAIGYSGVAILLLGYLTR